MTSSPERKLGSLRGQLLRWLLIPLAILVALDAISVYQNALEAADQAYDRSLLASTRALAERVTIVNGKVAADVPYVALDSFETDTLGRLYYKVTGLDGEMVAGFDDLPPLPRGVKRSEAYPALVYFYPATYHGEAVRIAALYQPVYDDTMRGIALIQVGESQEARRDLSRKILVETLSRQALLVAAAALLAWIAVSIVLRPLMQLKADVEVREPTDLSDFDPSHVHKEVRPLVAAMNGYMGRLDRLITGQRRFIADASHQLRTPLTVLKTQAELALRENDPRALRDIVEGMARTTDATVHLANRLLTLARAGHGSMEAQQEDCALGDLLRHVGLELAQQAVAKDIDLSFEGEANPSVLGNGLLLHEMVANLVDNAIRYTPAGGQVTLRAHDDPPRIEVEDSGPGVPPDERERVFAPFYRTSTAHSANAEGTGLGLTIVRDIAALHQARVTLRGRPQGSGLLAEVSFSTSRHGA
ncbi:sensor histidine kinase [Noviherbaspirillum galbum]|uniref:histidine kinase n=1 Tax=Noviherbaspirillum galbum TaxID=2709383 RepID=A0A6B3SSB4_9BURK|nr:sensor histidine kinase [Noviherbaspirillum galbum]NEX63584.1 sensor histidine kinase [Noviherbaspirillum galbum]